MSRKVLIAEDDEGVRTVIRHWLEKAGYDVTEATDGDVALRALRAAPYDVAIVDILMPEKDGLETIMCMRREMPDAKVIAISGRENLLFLNDARGLGADRTLTKPFTPQQLLDTVTEVLNMPSCDLCPARAVPAGIDGSPRQGTQSIM